MFGEQTLRPVKNGLKVVWCVGTVFVTLSLTVTEALKRFSSLPILVRESFWR